MSVKVHLSTKLSQVLDVDGGKFVHAVAGVFLGNLYFLFNFIESKTFKRKYSLVKRR